MSRAAFHFQQAFLLLVVLTLFSTVSVAQSFFNFGSNIGNTSSSQNQSESGVISPEEYKSRVNSLGKQNQDELTRAAQHEAPAQVTPPAPAETEATTKANPPTQTVTAPAPTEQPVIPASTPVSAAPATIAPILPAPPAKTPENQIYTGFGNSDKTQTNTNTNSSPDKSTGWKIQY